MQDNIQAQQGIVSKLSDDQLVKEVKTPSGSAPTYLVMAEMQKRDSIRNAMGGSAPKGTVRDQMLQGAEMRQPRMPMPQVDPAAIAGMMQARGMAPRGMLGMPQGMPPMPQGMPQGAPQMPQGAPPAAGIAGAAQMAGPQGFANGGAIPRYANDQVVTLPKLSAGTANQYGLYSPEEYARNLNTLSDYYNKDNVRPGDLTSYSSDVMNQFGGPEAFTKPFNAPIDAARSQLSGMMDPRSQALIQAGVAMMGAPNGSLLAGLGVGLGAGMTGYQKAQLEQRGLQDRMADLQLRQSQAGLQGRMQSMEIGSRERQGALGQFNTERQLNAAQASNILGLNATGATSAQQHAEMGQKIAADIALAKTNNDAAWNRDTRTLGAGAAEKIEATRQSAANNYYQSWVELHKTRAGMAPTAQQQQAAWRDALAAGDSAAATVRDQFGAHGVSPSILAGPDGRPTIGPIYSAPPRFAPIPLPTAPEKPGRGA